jgi:peptidoglycan hydrolase CwlO-like protein
MKNILTVLFIFIFCISSYSQVEYPRIEKDTLGQIVVIMTIEQAQDIDNRLELLSLFENLNAQIGDYDSLCIKVINEKDKVIATQDIKIENLNSLNDNKDAQIDNLKQQISEYQKKEATYQQEIENKDKEIKLHKEKISKQKTKMIVGSSIGGALIIALILSIVN